jgi:hypothetical protein
VAEWVDIFATEGAVMASKDKGGAKSSKTAASKTLKEKRAAKKAKGSDSGSSSWSSTSK